MFRNYFKTAWRNLQRNKIYSFINIAGLSIGLACSMLIMLYVKDEVSFDKFHSNVNSIYRVTRESVGPDNGGKPQKDGNTGFFQGPKFTANIPGIKSFVRIQSGREDIKNGTEITSKELLYVDSNFFSMFDFPLLGGSPTRCLTDVNAVVLSADEARKQFGTTNAVGKTVLVKKDDQFKPYTVTAVAKNTPQNSSIRFDILLPLKVSAEDYNNNENWFNIFLNTFVELEPAANIAAIESGMQRFYEQDSKEALKAVTEKYGPMNWKDSYHLQQFTNMHLSTELPPQNGLSNASNPMYSYILSGIALFILLIACINFINLTIARSVRRAKEIGIRKVIGGDRKQLILQFLGESFLLCLFSFVFAIVLVTLVLPVFNDLSNKALVISYLFDVKLVGAYILLFFITALCAGFYPALVLSGYDPVQTLYSRFVIGSKNYLQKSLVVLQFSLASFLIIATLVIYNQFNFLTQKELGYDDTNLITVDKNGLSRDEAKLFRTTLLKNPDIVGVAAKNGGMWGTRAKVNIDSTINFTYETVDESYIPLLKIKIIQGRNFSADYPSDSSSSVLVNEAFVKKAGWKDPLKEQVNFWYDNNKKYNVIGVVKDYHFESLNSTIGPELFTMKKDNWYGKAFIKIKPGTATTSVKYLEKTFKSMFPISPFVYDFKDEQNRKSYEAEAKWKQIMLFSAILTIFISCIGLFGLATLAAEKRTKEIGIRKVLGASVTNIATTLSNSFVKLVLIAVILAFPAAWYVMNQWLQKYPYRAEMTWWIFASAAILVLLIALCTVSFQAIKAAVANPVKSLRTE
jgi:putative ABC transport system permease protein